jgi:hypothetical protein
MAILLFYTVSRQELTFTGLSHTCSGNKTFRENKIMATEHYVDRVENLRLQGPVITLSFVRVQAAEPEQEAPTEEVVKLTMTTQNMVNMTNVLTQALQQMSSGSQTSPTQ